jgi:WD40 repeat protein
MRDQDRQGQSPLSVRTGESATGRGYPGGGGGSPGDEWWTESMRPERPPRQQGRGKALLVALAVVVIAGGIGGFGIYQSHRTAPPRKVSTRQATPAPIQALLSIDASISESCPTGIAWSPDGLTLAVAADGEQTQCDTADPGRTQDVTLYDARTGAQLKRINIFLTLQQLKVNAGSAYAMQPSWSPDGSMIVVPFDLLDTTGQHSGLIVIPTGRDAPRVVIDTADTQLVLAVWNLKTGKLAATQTKALPQALTYTWSADGSIQPGEPVPTRSVTDYTGSPVGQMRGASFSRWRDGWIAPVTRMGYFGAPLAWFHSDVGAFWSPDSQFVAPNYSIATRLPEPAGGWPAELSPQDSACIGLAGGGEGSTVATSLDTTYCAQPALPYPDAAYAAVVASARAGAQITDGSGRMTTVWNGVEVAWRPDGKVLATMLPADDVTAGSATARVTLYDTASGKVLVTLSQAVMERGSQVNSSFYLSWSPTGQQLALVSNGDSRVIVWGASSLAGLPPVGH